MANSFYLTPEQSLNPINVTDTLP